jgi:hypothetical protein
VLGWAHGLTTQLLDERRSGGTRHDNCVRERFHNRVAPVGAALLRYCYFSQVAAVLFLSTISPLVAHGSASRRPSPNGTYRPRRDWVWVATNAGAPFAPQPPVRRALPKFVATFP